MRAEVLESIKARKNLIVRPFVLGSSATEVEKDGAKLKDGDDEPELKVKEKKKGSLGKGTKKRKKLRKKTKTLKASSKAGNADSNDDSGSADVSAVKHPACKPCATKQDNWGPNYEPQKYMTAFKLFMQARKVEGVQRPEANALWLTCEERKSLLEGMSHSELKRRRFVK